MNNFRQPPIRVSVADTKERKRRQRELWLAVFGIVVIAVMTVVELKYIGINSYLFLVLFNLNVILMSVVLFVVIRNMVKLILERRRKVLGSRLRTRLVLSFMLLSLIPTLLMFFVAVKFVQTSVDYWFKSQVESSMEQSLEVGREFYKLAQSRMDSLGLSIIGDIRGRKFAWGGKIMDSFLEERKAQHQLQLIGVITPDGKRQNWHADPIWEGIWGEVEPTVPWQTLAEAPAYWSDMRSFAHTDASIGILPVDEGNTGFLVLGEDLGPGLLARLNDIVAGVEEYKKLRTLKSPLKGILYLTLGLMTLSIILGSMWFGFRLAKELSAPIQALAIGTQRVARGDLSVRLDDKASDEMGVLVQSFNRMAEDLQQSEASIRRVNQHLNEKNVELEARGKYIEAVLDNITAGVISLDENGRISKVNTAAETMLGLDARELTGMQPVDLVQGEYAELVGEVAAHLATSPDTTWQRQMEIPVGSRQMTFLVNAVALKTDDGRDAGLVAVFEDITELEKMQRLAAWREVARRIAHEIKNPLTPIKLSAQRLERKYGSSIDDKVFGECTGMIVRQVEQMQQMVKEFSVFAKLPEVAPRPDDMAGLLKEVVGDFRHSHRGIEWYLQVPENMEPVRFDRDGMSRVMINLLSNAADVLEAAKHNGELGGGAGDENGGMHSAGQVEVLLSFDAILRQVRIEVRDNGPGLSDEERSRIFEPYFSRKKGGTGLGLTIARSIVTDHYGFIRVRPNQPTGTIFVIELPAG
jgi:two-component system nitrogen regulation sensor histidine kinase NtrY